MPTANANVGSGFGGAVSYALQEKKELPKSANPVVLLYNQTAGTSKEIGFQMREIAGERKAVKKPVLHLQVNFHPDEKVNRKQAEKAIQSILSDLGIDKDNHQYVVVQHRDKAHDHYHVVANRIGLDGSLVNDHRILDRLQVACDKVEKLQGLRATEGRTVIYDPSQSQGFSYVKSEESRKAKKPLSDKNEAKKAAGEYIQKSLDSVLATATSAEGLKETLLQRNIDTKLLINKNGVYGISFRTDKIAFKGTEVGFKWKEISQKLEANQHTLEQSKPKLPHKTEERLLTWLDDNKGINNNSIALTDEAIRQTMRTIKPGENPWTTWSGFANEEANYKWLEKAAQEKIQEKKLEIKMEEYIEGHAAEAFSAIQLADQAIRIVMREHKPDQNPWQTFESLSNPLKIYKALVAFAEKAIEFVKAILKPQTGDLSPSAPKAVEREGVKEKRPEIEGKRPVSETKTTPTHRQENWRQSPSPEPDDEPKKEQKRGMRR